MKQLRLTRHRIFLNAILISFGIRFSFLCIRAFGGLVMPHVWRQTDTLGVSLRYWLRFTQESNLGAFHLILPAVLQAGDGNGITPMEFPFLNLIFSPLWILGALWGKIIIYQTFASLIFYLIHQLSKKGHWYASALLLLPTLSWSADYIEKFLPDTLAMLFITYGCVIFFERRWKGLTLITLALLMKPTAVVGLAFLFFIRKFRKNPITEGWPIALSLAVCGLYYTKGMGLISSFTINTPKLFATSLRNPIQSLFEVFHDYRFVMNEFTQRVFMFGGSALIMLAVLFRFRRYPIKLLFWGAALIIFMFTTISALDGEHMKVHDYYLVSAAPVACAVFYFFIRNSRRWVIGLASFLIVLHAIELSVQNLSPHQFKDHYSKYQEASALIARNPSFPWKQAHPFRSNTEPFPALGIIFGEMEGSKSSEFGFFTQDSPEWNASGCTKVDESPHFVLVRCPLKS